MWKFEPPELDDNKKIAEARFTELRKRFQKNPDLFFEYRKLLPNYLKEDIIEYVPPSDCESNNVTFYLLHREVISKDRLLSQLHIAFDGSSHNKNSASLNSYLHVGLNLYPEVFDILLRFRFNAVAFAANMRQPFL